MFETLKQHAERLTSAALPELAAARSASGASLEAAGWSIDLSRQRLDVDAETALMEYAAQNDLTGAISRLFEGEKVNSSEDRAALHWALRAPSPLTGELEIVRSSALAAEGAANAITRGTHRTAGDEAFNAVVHIGIGGSDFGPRLVADAFHDRRRDGLELRFCANLDPLDLDLALAGLDPARTLVIGVSKSFGTEETLYNLGRARDWVKAAVGDGWARHFVLVTANKQRAEAWAGGSDSEILLLPEAVGGRFSIWSAGSLACAITLEPVTMEEFRAGAAEMDALVQTSKPEDNPAIRLALLDYWNASVLGHRSRALLAYSRRLRALPAYLQQLEMESNGKSTGPDGSAVSQPTAPSLWGGEGTIGQHSYHQWLHQGTTVVPTEFVFAPGATDDAEGVRALAAHALAQAEVFCNGRDLETVKREEPGLSDEISKQKVHPGGRPSSFFTADKLDPRRLGSLIALFEHRTYLAGVLWGINSFDQWGVERGKTVAGKLKPALKGDGKADDPVTARLIAGLGLS